MKGGRSDLTRGKEAWKHLERIAYSRSVRAVFDDWLDLMLSAYLFFTDNFARPDFEAKFKAQKLDGPYEKRYMEIVAKYADIVPPRICPEDSSISDYTVNAMSNRQ
jgi:hypothetical protein